MTERNKTKDRDPREATDDAERNEAARWKEENAEAIKAYNEWVKREGLPFAKFRQF
jgi:post-segregation antitoxin (ccd killing protein)